MRARSEALQLDDSPSILWRDRDLVEACLAGDERAWSAIISKYKNLVYSAPLRYRMQPEDAADVFQCVWAELFSELHNLRKVEALRTWLIKVALNKCYQWKRKQAREATIESTVGGLDVADPLPLYPAVQQDLDQQQRLREAISTLPERCRMMIHLLFYADPPKPYADVAHQLGLATGSIGFIRGRCLKKLRQALKEVDF
jgi:RNA polymerase sigma factor (sigma-70 family)